MTRSQKPRWPLILSMKSASERRCRKRKGGGQTGRDKQDGANAACFKYPGVSDSSTYAFKFCIYHFTRLFSTNCMPDIMLGQWKGRAWPRGSHPSVCVRVCVRVCVCVCVCACMPVCTQGVSSRPYLWASPRNIGPHGCPFSAAWVRVFLGCFPFLHGPFSFCILVSA